MTAEHAEIMRQAEEAVWRSFAGLSEPLQSGPTTIAGCPAHVEIDHDAGVAHICLMPPLYEVEVEIGFEPCPT